MNNTYKHILLTLTILIMFPGLSCDKQNFRFPEVPVNVYLGIFNDLATLGQGEFGFYRPQDGVNGLLIYRSFDDQYYAFDRTCTYEPDFSCAVETDPDNSLLLKCPCCGSEYLIDSEGIVNIIQGPAVYALVEYHAVIEGENLHVFN